MIPSNLLAVLTGSVNLNRACARAFDFARVQEPDRRFQPNFKDFPNFLSTNLRKYVGVTSGN